VWESLTWPAWRDVKDLVDPSSEAVWVDEFLVKDAIEWLREHLGIVWYEHAAFGEKLAEVSGHRFYGPGPAASEGIIQETGNVSIIASLRAHGNGKNLQAFNDCLVANVPSNGAVWEQMLGRIHRPGQPADEVNCTVYQHSESVLKAFEDARRDAQYIQQSTGSRQKLCYCVYNWSTGNVLQEGASKGSQ
jgi:hypothetical protein